MVIWKIDGIILTLSDLYIFTIYVINKLIIQNVIFFFFSFQAMKRKKLCYIVATLLVVFVVVVFMIWLSTQSNCNIRTYLNLTWVITLSTCFLIISNYMVVRNYQKLIGILQAQLLLNLGTRKKHILKYIFKTFVFNQWLW